MGLRKHACRTIAVAIIGWALAGASAALAAEAMTLTARLARPVMKSQDGQAEGQSGGQANYLRIGLNGCEPQRKADRTPVNVAFVIDRSGSMGGERIAQAREAAVMAVRRLDAGDIASVVVFDDRVDVPVPARKVADQGYFIDRIRQVGVRGSTAIHAGVNAGADEVRKFKDAHRLNRVVLLSDGQANVGPSRPDDFADLGRKLLAEGISVSTIGLGADYNEDLMLALARAADGNHAFASAPTDLVQIFNREFDDVLASCAQMVEIDVELAPGVHAVRALSRDGTIAGAHAKFQLNQVYAATDHYVLIEVAFDGASAAEERNVGVVHVAYTAPGSDTRQTLEAPIRARFGASDAEVAANVDNGVMESVIEQTARERAARAVALRDQGRIDEARALLAENAREIDAFLASSPSDYLLNFGQKYSGFASGLAQPGQWNAQRKMLRQMDSQGAAAGSRSRY
jgi:Ca-activated chloride channel family protein